MLDTTDETIVNVEELVEVEAKIQELRRMRRTLVAERTECTAYHEGGYLYEIQTFTRKYKI
ncbi:hypothetical protein DPMN_164854 [Dreissena polymorpha]|uniref:Uncharacterized protein n=1 Tax=Dreissena polymorpha TaxID=45954 RepID=A0A9D4EUC4_DREPO|nr:hypothetical protein DPMN_164854 [Dreissena polymorpha]